MHTLQLILKQGSRDHLLKAKPSGADVFEDLPVFLIAELGIFCQLSFSFGRIEKPVVNVD